MKLELKHLAPYLPYKLKAKFMHPFVKHQKIGIINNAYNLDDDVKLSIDYSDDEHIWMYKPILRPLSDLNYRHWLDIFAIDDIDNILSEFQSNDSLDCVEYYLVVILLTYHFDVFGLIETGLAIDINTL